MNKNTLCTALISLTALGIAGCAAKPKPAPVSAHKAKFEQGKKIDRSFGIWHLKNCQLKAVRGGITLKTEGRLSNKTLFFRMVAPFPLGEAPKLSLWGIGGFDLKLEGRHAHWSFEIPYRAHDVAQMITDKAFIAVQYRQENSQQKLNAIFSTQSLPEALEVLNEYCLEPQKHLMYQ